MSAQEITTIKTKIHPAVLARLQVDFQREYGFILWPEPSVHTFFYIEVPNDDVRDVIQTLVVEMRGWIRGYLARS